MWQPSNTSVITKLGHPLDVVSSCIRGAFRAPEGKTFVVADLSAIENRVLAWIADCQEMTDVYVNNLDPYIEFASKYLFKIPREQVTKIQRQSAKPAVLGCGYQLSGGSEGWICTKCGELRIPEESVCAFCESRGIIVEQTDIIKTGLWGYAENMGVNLTREQAHDAVKAFREAYVEVKQLWKNLQRAAIKAVLDQTTVEAGKCTFIGRQGLLIVYLPSGRPLYYVRPYVNEGEYGPYLCYWGVDSVTKQWRVLTIYGGKWAENLVQAISRDVLAEGMLRADEAGMTIVGHTHDEIISLENEGEDLHLSRLILHMTRPMPWASDLILGADGYTAKVYRK